MSIFNETNSTNEINNLATNQVVRDILPVSLGVSFADYNSDVSPPPYGCLTDARNAAKFATELGKLANRCNDPVKASMMKSCADALWQSSVDTYSFVFRQRGFT